MMRDADVARSVGGFVVPHTVVVSCGISTVTQLITRYLDTVSVPYPTTTPPLVLVDLPHGFGFHHLEHVSQRGSPVIVVTHNRCPEYLEDLWALQPTVLLAGDNLLGELVYAIERAAHGERYRRTPGQPVRLTSCERLLLRKLAHGWSNKQIADCHGLQPKTVSNQITLLCEKLHVRDRMAAALYYWGHPDFVNEAAL